MIVLGIETSCDETSAALIDEKRVYSSIISSQAVHLRFGGVVPELASRAHLRKIGPIVDEAFSRAGLGWDDVDGLAVTFGPGLVGALLVGVNYVKGLALVHHKPFVGVNHIEGHVYSNFLQPDTPSFPLLCLIVSGGHTQLVVMEDHLRYKMLGKTRDDAVGEAFDKVAKLLGLPYPGGPEIDRRARLGNPDYTTFPIGLSREKTFDFSYSGLKTAVLNFANSLGPEEKERHLNDICAAFQKAAVGALVERTIRAARTYQIKQIAVAGGVAANSELREQLTAAGESFRIKVYFPEMRYCTDNAAMIARAGLERLKNGDRSGLELNAYPSLALGEERQQHG